MKKCLLLIVTILSLLSLYAQNDFIFPVEDVFTISGRGTVATGKIERGMIKTGDSVEIIGLSQNIIKSKITGIEAFNKVMTVAKSGDNIGLLLSGVPKEQVTRGMVICKPGAIKAYSNFKCQLQLLKKEEGGRSTPVFDKYRPQFIFYTATVTGQILLPAGTESMAPGDNATVTVKLIDPAAMLKDMEFVIKEGGRVVGKGKVSELIE
ncbi:MAG: EF-Tu/IF-2/RF-3 family GTPase [Chitinophagaceae bacterium]